MIQDGFECFVMRATAGRERATRYASNATGCDGKLVAYCSTQTHPSVEKAVKIAGLGAPLTCGLLPWTKSSRCVPRSWHDRLSPTSLRAWFPASCAPPWYNLVECDRPGAWRLRRSAVNTESGCMWTPPCRARRRCARSFAIFMTGGRARRQLLLQSAQMDVHEFRLRCVLRG